MIECNNMFNSFIQYRHRWIKTKIWNIIDHFQSSAFLSFHQCEQTEMESMHLGGFLFQRGEMGDTSELYKSDDSLPRQTYSHVGLSDRSTD